MTDGNQLENEYEEKNWSSLSQEDKKRKLFLKQKELLETILQHGAISKEQYYKSFNDLKEKMEM